MEDHHPQQGMNRDIDGLEVPPGFRFHPSDEEIITFYLTPKILDNNFTAVAIGEVDINKSEPWELPAKAKMGENEWYFYSIKDRKYPTGLRANRATEAGYWKATGKDREIYHAASEGPILVGMKKTLVFYEGRAPKGAKTNWVMHEYRLEGTTRHSALPIANSNTDTKKPSSASSSKVEWVVCRVFHKCSSNKKAPELTPESTPAQPAQHMTISGGAINFRSMPTQSSMGQEDFTINTNQFHPLTDPSASFYSTNGMGPLMSPVLPPLPPIVGMGSVGLQMNTGQFGNPMATMEPMTFYHPVGGETRDCSFVTEPNIRPTSMLLQDAVMSLNQSDDGDISSVVTPRVVASSTVDMNNIWKY